MHSNRVYLTNSNNNNNNCNNQFNKQISSQQLKARTLNYRVNKVNLPKLLKTKIVFLEDRSLNSKNSREISNFKKNKTWSLRKNCKERI